MSKLKVYISGQISGLPFEEVKAKFDKAEIALQEKGWDVVNPVNNGLPFNAPWELHVSIDIILLMGCTAIYLLPDWYYSRGATLEKNIAEQSGKVLIYEESPAFMDLKQAITNITGVSFFDIVGESRLRKHVFARMIFAYFCRKEKATIVQIAKEMKHNHSTVIYYLRKFEDDYKYNPDFKRLVEAVEKELSKILLRP